MGENSKGNRSSEKEGFPEKSGESYAVRVRRWKEYISQRFEISINKIILILRESE